MSWRRTDPVKERVEFVGLWSAGGRTIAGLCQQFGISRKTGYKWLARYEAEGTGGLEDRSKANVMHPNETSARAKEAIVEVRRTHPTWGPRKVLAWLHRRKSELELPAPSTAGRILASAGLVRPRRCRRGSGSIPGKGPVDLEPNALWTVDFKGQFRTQDGQECYPLTVMDRYSRYLVGCDALEGPSEIRARPVFERYFREFGMPWEIQSDNGSPFASNGLGRLSKLSVWWMKLEICVIRSRVRHPEDNGSHERMHRTLKAETTRPPGGSALGQQKKFDRWTEEYNHERPHEALDGRTPAELYRRSTREYPSKLAPVEYPGHYEVRGVDMNGLMTWKGRRVYVSKSLAGERMGLVEVEDGLWRMYFGKNEIGVLRERRQGRLWRGREKVLPMRPV